MHNTYETSKPSACNEQRYREITELISDDVYSFQITADGSLEREWGLDIFREITGYTPEEFDTHAWHIIVHPEDRTVMEQRIEAFRTGQPIVSDYRIVTKAGEIRWVRDHGRAVLDEAGNLVRLYGAIKDITREKLIEEHLARYHDTLQRQIEERTQQVEQSEKNLRALLNAIQEAALLMKPDGTVLYVNETAAHRLGTTVADMIGTDALERISPELAARRRAYMQQVVATGEPVRFEDVRDGRSINNTVYPIHDSSGNVSSVAIFAIDLTEHKLVKEAYQNLVDHSLQGFVIFQDGRIVFANRAMTTINGYTVDELLAFAPDKIESLIYSEDREMVWRYLRLRMAGEDAPSRYEYRIVCKQGDIRWVESYGVRICYGGRLAVQGAYVDITERKHAEHQIRSLNAMLAHRAEELASTNEELEAFSYSVAHDLRSPLWTIDLTAEMVLDDYEICLEDEGQQLLRRIRVNAQRMMQMVESLLTLAHVTRSTKHDEQVNLSNLAHDIIRELHQKEPDRHVQVTIEQSLTARCDPRLVSILLDNLLSNAWKFTQKTEHAAIEMGHATRSSNGQSGAIFFIRDNGVGFDSTQAHRLFRTFQRLHDAREFAGMGIGLATVRRIVERYGGHIWAESAVGTGTTLYFTLEPVNYADMPDSTAQVHTVQGLIQQLEDDLVERSRLHPEQDVFRLLVDSVVALQHTSDGMDFGWKTDEDARADKRFISLLVHELNTPLQTMLLLLDLMLESGEQDSSLLVERIRHQVEHIGHIIQSVQERYL